MGALKDITDILKEIERPLTYEEQIDEVDKREKFQSLRRSYMQVYRILKKHNKKYEK